MSDDEIKDELEGVEPELDPNKVPGLLATDDDEVVEEEDGTFDPEDLGIEDDVDNF